MIFCELHEFGKEFKKLLKKYPSLSDDFDDFKLALEDDPTGVYLPQKHIVMISGLGEEIEGDFYKVRKFLCKSLRSTGDIRIIYKYSYEHDTIEFYEIEFIEIYHKNQKENHDIERIKKYYKK